MISKKLLPCGRPAPPVKEQTEPVKDLLKRLVLQLNSYCTEQQLNRSEAREKILDTIVGGHRHFTALELLERLQKRFPEVGKATLYRNLPVLVDSGVLQEGPQDANGQSVYEISDDDHHDHIVCMNCKKIFEFHDDKIEKRQNQVSSTLGFTPHHHRHVIFADCDYLRKTHQ